VIEEGIDKAGVGCGSGLTYEEGTDDGMLVEAIIATDGDYGRIMTTDDGRLVTNEAEMYTGLTTVDGTTTG
jgi:hypothetical protein